MVVSTNITYLARWIESVKKLLACLSERFHKENRNKHAVIHRSWVIMMFLTKISYPICTYLVFNDYLEKEILKSVAKTFLWK